jgi:hypothetical protein
VSTSVFRSIREYLLCSVAFSAVWLQSAGVRAEGGDEKLARLIGSDGFSLRCIGPLAGDIELNIDPRHRLQAPEITASLRARLTQGYTGKVFERRGPSARLRAATSCEELQDVTPESAEVHVSLVRGEEDEFTDAILVVRTAVGKCRRVNLRSDLSPYQCPGRPPDVPPDRKARDPVTHGMVKPEAVRPLVARRSDVEERGVTRGSVLLGGMVGLSGMSLALRFAQIGTSNDGMAIPSGVTWLMAFALAGPAGYYTGRYWGQPNQNRATGLGLGGGVVALSGILLKSIAWARLEGVEGAGVMLYADVATVGGLAMFTAALGSRVTLRASASSLSLVGRF